MGLRDFLENDCSRFDPVLDRTVREVGGEQCCWVGTHGGAGVKDVSG